jgi:phosphogluconate dehydratase
VPAMCDGVTQGTPGMELSLFSRDAIAMATAVALSHDVFDGALLLGVCDKIVPGLLIGALHYGHLPCVFVPAGPMGTGCPTRTIQGARAVRPGPGGARRAAQGRVRRLPQPRHLHLLRHGQQQPDAAGSHGPACARRGVCTRAPRLREAFTRQALRTVLDIGNAASASPIGRLVDERCIVNAMVALLATGGSTNHLIHWVAVARSAGILIDWTDFDELSSVVPLLARVYPNGDADVNQFQAAGGPALARVRDGDVIRLDANSGTLEVRVSENVWAAREVLVMPPALRIANAMGTGRELFANMRRNASTAEEGACSWL